MRIVEFSNLQELAPYAVPWDHLAAGVPFRTWAWMSSWWRHYGHEASSPCGGRLLVLGVLDPSDRLVGLAPWHLQRRRSQGAVLRWLGTGEVCSDYLSLLCEPAVEDCVAEALADYLLGRRENGQRGPRWDLLEIEGVDAEDGAVTQLVRHLTERGCLVHNRSSVNCWRIALPGTWEEYLAMLSRNHRRQMRHAERTMFDSGRAVLHTVQCRDELPQAISLLVDLHQRRRQMLGQPGCFASKRFAAFHQEVMPMLLANGQLRLHWLQLDGRPAAAQYTLSGDGILYVYQAGVDPEMLCHQPGRLINQQMVRRAIEQGYRGIDFLRGDEPYKSHLRALRRPSLALRIIPNRPVARLREKLWLAGRSVKRWVM